MVFVASYFLLPGSEVTIVKDGSAAVIHEARQPSPSARIDAHPCSILRRRAFSIRV